MPPCSVKSISQRQNAGTKPVCAPVALFSGDDGGIIFRTWNHFFRIDHQIQRLEVPDGFRDTTGHVYHARYTALIRYSQKQAIYISVKPDDRHHRML